MTKVSRGRLALALLATLAACAINPPTVSKISDKYFAVAHPLRYSPKDAALAIIVPVGFLTDLASIPRALWWWESPIDRSMAPAIVHDFLYWEQSCTKDEADAVLFLAMGETGVRRDRQWSVYGGVRTPLGDKAWNGNTAARARGETRFLTPAYLKNRLDAPVEAEANLGSIAADAKEKGGLVFPASPDQSVKRACAAALRIFNSERAL